MTIAAMRGVPVILQDEQTSGDGTVIAIPSSFINHKITVIGSNGVSAGAVQPETSDDAINWAPLGGGDIDVPDDDAVAYNFVGVYGFIRVPISTPVVDGTVTVTYQGTL